ncbi:hypothetical protein [Lewinella sp. IMCC34191]|uniref:hypothetical protein n=1 Tax=Lewinella sp. IMCC34191 TaxID=2259172 RepID=UPI000E257930|nr:hypothetical protein [Lewinella sp. IMCC34191]
MRVTELIEGARRLQDGKQRERGAAQVRTAVEEEMPLRYAMPLPPEVETTFHRRGQPTRTRRGQWHELVQHLTDLAYLRPTELQAWHEHREASNPPTEELLRAVVGGVINFVTEDDYAPLRMLPPPPALSLREQIEWTERYLSTVVFRLSQLTSFDNELPVRTDYRVGEPTAYGRSLAFRMRALFFDYRSARHTTRRKIYFDASLLPQLVALTSFIAGASTLAPSAGDEGVDPELQRLLLDGDHLFDAYRAQNRVGPDGSGRMYLQYRLRADSPPVDEAADRREGRLRRRAERWVRRNDDRLDTGSNHFGVRLMQLSLWRAGFYTGRLDGDVGLLTHLALIGLIEQEREYGNIRDRRLDRVLLPVTEGTDWVVDFKLLARLLERYIPPPLEEAKREEDEIWERIRASGQEEQLDEAFVSRQREVKPYYGELARHPARRVYYGIRGLIRGAFRAVGRIIKWVGGVVEEVLGAVFDFVKSLAKRLQEGIGMFLAGFRFFAHYLLGRPFISLGAEGEAGQHPVLFTRFRIDFDVVSFIDRGAGTEDVARHMAYLQRTRAGATYFLDVVATCLQTVALLQPPLGWLRLAVLLARVVHGFLRDDTRPARAVA